MNTEENIRCATSEYLFTM